MNDLVALGEFQGVSIAARPEDQYINATQMCKAVGKFWANYWENQQAQEFVAALSADIGIPISGLVFSIKGGTPEHQGTWVHRRVAIHLAQWCSAKFAVWVSRQIETIFDKGRALVPREHAEAVLAEVFGPSFGAAMVGFVEMSQQVVAGQQQVVEGQQKLVCMFSEFGQSIHNFQHEMRSELGYVQADVTSLKSDATSIKSTVDRFERRREITERTKRKHKAVVQKFYHCKCPLCAEVPIVDERGSAITSAIEFDHFVARSRPSPRETWPVCKKCNQRLENLDYRCECKTHFEAYQLRRKDFDEGDQRELF